MTYNSLIPLNFSQKTNYFAKPSKLLPSKLFVRKSYLILLWFSYLSRDTFKKVKLKVRVLKKKKTMLTLTKAPMAHKKSSKEQFFSSLHFFSVSYTLPFKNSNACLPVGSMNYYLKNVLKTLPFIETNLLFLKTSTLTTAFNDTNYFSY